MKENKRLSKLLSSYWEAMSFPQTYPSAHAKFPHIDPSALLNPVRGEKQVFLNNPETNIGQIDCICNKKAEQQKILDP